MYSKLKKSFIKYAFFIGLLGYSNIALSSFYEDPGEGTSASRSVKLLEFDWLNSVYSKKSRLIILYTREATKLASNRENCKKTIEESMSSFLNSQEPYALQEIWLQSKEFVDFTDQDRFISFFHQQFLGSNIKIFPTQTPKPLELRWLDPEKTKLFIGHTGDSMELPSHCEIRLCNLFVALEEQRIRDSIKNFLDGEENHNLQRLKIQYLKSIFDNETVIPVILKKLSGFNITELDHSQSITSKSVSFPTKEMDAYLHLQSLDISDNTVGVEVISNLGSKLPALKKLILSNVNLKNKFKSLGNYLCYLVEKKAGSFHNSLTHLDLSHNPNLNGEGLQQVVDAFPNLEFLDLTDTGIERIEDIPECPLKLTMDVSGNPFYIRGLEDEAQAIGKVLAVLGSISEDGRADQEPSSSDALPNPKPFPSIVLEDIVLRQTGVEILGAEFQVERFYERNRDQAYKAEIEALSNVNSTLWCADPSPSELLCVLRKIYQDSLNNHLHHELSLAREFRAHLKDLKTRRGVKPYLIKHPSAS